LIPIVKSCPKLEAVGIPVGSWQCLSRLLDALGPSSGTLRTIHFYASEPAQTDWPTTPQFINSLLADPSLRRVESLTVEDDELDETFSSTLLPSVQASPQSLEIVSFHRSFDEMKRSFVQDPSSLRTLKVEIHFDYRNMNEINWIYDYSPSRLDKLFLSRPYSRKPASGPLSTYLQPVFHPLLLPYHFPSLPFLRRLDLHGYHGPSLQLLTNLVTVTPSLVYLSFAKSWWKPDSHLDPSTPPSVFVNLVFPEQDILATLLSFSHLRFVDLGYLPTIDREDYRGLEESLKENGIEAEWSECEEW